MKRRVFEYKLTYIVSFLKEGKWLKFPFPEFEAAKDFFDRLDQDGKQPSLIRQEKIA